MFGCGVTVLQNMASLSSTVAVVHHWIPGFINCHTIAMAEEVNYNENKPRIYIFNDVIIVAVNLKLIRNR